MDGSGIDPSLRADAIASCLERAERAGSIAERRFAVEQAARALSLADPGSVAAELRTRARSLGVEEAAIAVCEDEPPPHAVRVPLVERASGEAFVRMFWVEFDPSGGALERPALDEGARAALSDALAHAARLAPPPRSHDRFRFTAARPQALASARIEGESLAAAALVSAVALWSERPTRSGLAITGAIAGKTVAKVGSVADKARAALRAGCTAIVVPAENAAAAREVGGIEVMAVGTVGELLEAALEADRVRVDPEQASREACAAFAEGWKGYRWPAIAEKLARTSGTLPDARPDLQIEVLARLAAARRHLGDPEDSLRILAVAEAIAEAAPDAVPDGPLGVLHRQRAMTLRRLFRFTEAARAASRAVRIAKRGRLRGDCIKALGCVGLIELARGNAEAARAAFEEALALTLAHAPGDTARSRTYLLDALGRLGRIDEARAQFEAALRELEHDPLPARRAKESWVRVGWGGLLVGIGRFDEALSVLDVPAIHECVHHDPLPGLLARRHLGVAMAHAGQASASQSGLHLLAGSPFAYGRALEPGLRSLAYLNVLVEASVRVATGRFDADAAARAEAAVAMLPDHGNAQRWIGPARAAVLRALRRGDAGLGRALADLVARCEAL